MALYLEGKPSVDTNELSPKEATRMSHEVKYIGMDVHKEAIVIAVQNESGKLVMETIVEAKASSLLQFLHGLRGELHVTLEEGTWAAWLYDLLQPQVQEVVVCNPRRNALLKEGSKSDKVDAHKLADLLRTGMLRPVYHGENGLRTLRELARSYQTIGKDLTRVMNQFPSQISSK
jgi:transposase